MDTETIGRLKRGRTIRSVLQQIQYAPMPVADQIAIFMAVNAGLMDEIPEAKIGQAQNLIIQILHRDFSAVIAAITRKEKLSEETQDKMITAFTGVLKDLK